MLAINTDRIINRLNQLVIEIQLSCDMGYDYYDRLREFTSFCYKTPSLAQILNQLPTKPYDFSIDWRDISSNWEEGIDGYAMRWSAITQIVNGGPGTEYQAWLHLGVKEQRKGLKKSTELFVIPIFHYLIDCLKLSSTMLYLMLRYKRLAEWFEATNLRELYFTNEKDGEGILDENLRRFLFESGIDYPFSQPASPQGKVDIVANLETDDPLVLEIKIWDSNKNYKENRLRDGLRQVIDYATKYGKDKGYLVVFNLDEIPLSFSSQNNKGEWPSCIECGGRTYYFIDVHIAQKSKPISQLDKGKPVRTHEIDLNTLLDDTLK